MKSVAHYENIFKRKTLKIKTISKGTKYMKYKKKSLIMFFSINQHDRSTIALIIQHKFCEQI